MMKGQKFTRRIGYDSRFFYDEIVDENTVLSLVYS
jgi:hypothetical protein